MNPVAANFEDLLNLFFRKTSALGASEWLKDVRLGLADAKPLMMLHRVGSDAETDEGLRESLISLLKLYSIIEIGLVAKLIPEPSYEDFWLETSNNLSFAPFRTFYENYYPLVLPQFLLARLEGRLHLFEEGIDQKAAEGFYFFSNFIDIALRRKHPDIEFILQFSLHNGAVPFITKMIADKERLVAGALRTHKRDRADRLVQGLSRLLMFCEDLDRLLNASRDLPLFQSAMWTYFGDLFQTSDNHLAAFLLEAVAAFSGWIGEYPEHSQECKDEIQTYIHNMTRVIDRLTSGLYGLGMSAPLSELSPPLVEA